MAFLRQPFPPECFTLVFESEVFEQIDQIQNGISPDAARGAQLVGQERGKSRELRLEEVLGDPCLGNGRDDVTRLEDGIHGVGVDSETNQKVPEKTRTTKCRIK